MTWVILVPAVLMALLFVLIGWAVGCKKAYWLISGYNTATEEQKKRVDVVGLGRMIGKGMMIGALIPLAAGVAFALRWNAVAGVCFGLLFPWAAWLVIGCQRYDGNAVNTDGKWTRKTKGIVAGVVALLVVTAGFVAWILLESNRPVRYEIANDKLRIECAFGTSMALTDVRELELVGSLPPIAKRTNGAATGSHLKGAFTLESGGNAQIYARTDAPVLVRFLRGKTVYLLSGETEQQTRELYAMLGGK